ncbi:MAG: 6-bladed beta-propeller, partial [bacterium]|nr:6-bladed beta-propeller [bacterium]
KNADTPGKGELNFQLKKIWQVTEAGPDIVSSVRGLAVGDDGTVFISDKKNLRFYCFNSDGKFKRAFGEKGEGPGEIRSLVDSVTYTVGKIMLVLDSGRLNHFDADGKFIKSVLVSQQKYPQFFLNKNEFITAPLSLQNITGKKACITQENVATGASRIITEFTPTDETAINMGNAKATVQHPAVTPVLIIGHAENRLYFGMNDHYEITVSDMNGKVENTFGLTRDRKILTEKVKFDVIWKEARGRAPKEMVEKLTKAMPGEVTYFSTLAVHNNLIYVHMSHYDRKNIQRIDIFSPDGVYLYRASITLPKDQQMAIRPVLKNGFLYVVQEDEDGEITLNKYKITLPKR